MAYGKVSETFWHDDKIRALSESARYFMLYLMSCPHGNRLGLFVLDPMYAAADVGWTADQVRDALAELSEAERVRWDPDNRVVFVRNFLKHNTLLNKSVVKGAENDLASVPDTPLLEELAGVVRADLEGETGPARLHYASLMERIMHRIMSQKRKSRVVEPRSHNDAHNDGQNDGQTIQGRGCSKPTPLSTLESNPLELNDREGRAPDDQSDGLAQMVEEYPDAGRVLEGLVHRGGAESTASTLRQRFVFADERGAMPDKSVAGLDFAERRRTVAAALVEYRDRGNREWSSRHFAGFVRRERIDRGSSQHEDGIDPWDESA